MPNIQEISNKNEGGFNSAPTLLPRGTGILTAFAPETHEVVAVDHKRHYDPSEGDSHQEELRYDDEPPEMASLPDLDEEAAWEVWAAAHRDWVFGPEFADLRNSVEPH